MIDYAHAPEEGEPDALVDTSMPHDLDGWVWDDNSEDEAAEGEEENIEDLHGRMWLVHTRPEFSALHEKGLAMKPPGGGLAVHPEGRQWRSFVEDSKKFGRSWGGKTDRTSHQALVEVLVEAWAYHCDKHPQDKVAMKHLQRLKKEVTN